MAVLSKSMFDFFEDPRDEPYDPDMSVHEALRLGLIAVVDTGAIGATGYQPCGTSHPSLTMACTRMKGHKGIHAYVMRWEEQPPEATGTGYARRQELDRIEMERQRRFEQDELLRVAKAANKHMQQQAKEMREAMKQVADKVSIDMDKRLHKDDSMVYGPMSGAKKNQKFRDSNVGKVRK